MSAASGEARPEPVGVQIPELADASGLFASRLYAELAAKQDRGFNVVFSPLSVHLALSMTLVGAVGATREAMMKTLGIRDDKHEKALWQDVSRLMAFVDMNANGGEKQIDLAIANRMYLQSEQQPADAFLEVAREHFHSDAEKADFVGNAEGERVKINQFVSEATKGLINELLAKGSLDAHSRMVIVNAIYFKGQWKSQFDKALTKPRDFKGFEGKEVTSVQMMHSKDRKYFGAADTKIGDATFASLRIAYHGGYSMFFLVPDNSAVAVSALESELQKLGATAFLNQISQAQRENKYQTVMIPKCRLEYSVDLTAALKATGMEIAFSDSAEFNMVKSVQPLKISSVVHKAFMQLDEEGTTAAAATAVGLRAMCAVRAPLQPLEFIADHPFIALLAHDATHTPLFVAKVTRPINI